MKRRLLVVLVGLATNSLACVGQTRQYETMAICFYNFENLFDPTDDPDRLGDDDFTPEGSYRYTEEVYRKKLYNLSFVIRQIGTDLTPDGPALIGTAEIENARVLSDLVAQPLIRDRGYAYIHFDGPDARGIDVALLYQPRYFTPLSARPITVDISKTGEKGGKTRDILYVAGILGGDTVHLLVNHWPSRRGGESASAPLRAIAAGVARSLIDSLILVSSRPRVIVMGDFNDEPVSPSIVQTLGAKADVKDLSATDLYNPWVPFYKRGIGTLGHNDSWSLFDQIIISGNWLTPSEGGLWRYYRAEVFNRAFLKSRSGRYKGYPHRSFQNGRWADGYSDHFPTVIYLIRTKQ